MQKEDLKNLQIPYKDSKTEIDRRFHASIGANVPSTNSLAHVILNDFDTNNLGINWWSLPTQERILISDYLYQCVYGIETNLAEAKLHYLEWLDARNKENNNIADIISVNALGQPNIKKKSSIAPIDDLPNRLEAMHICGFFRAIGSSLDCLGAIIIGVLALNTKLRRSDIGTAEIALSKVTNLGTPGSQLQIDFRDFYQNTKNAVGVKDWFKWTNQYRNMLIHRGRLVVQHQIIPREHLFLDSREKIILRARLTTHLAKYPDRSDMETWIKGNNTSLNEDADTTLKGIFKSSKDFLEIITDRLLSVWNDRRTNPQLLEQPISQWIDTPKECDFDGYDNNANSLQSDLGLLNQILVRRLRAGAATDQQRHIWANSKWTI